MLSGNEQRWIIRQLVEGKLLNANPEEFDGYQLMLRSVLAVPQAQRQLALLEHLSSSVGGREMYDQIMESTPPEQSSYPSYADLDLPPVDWFWKRWMANQMMAILVAQPGAGKSMVALDLARRVIHGLPCPDGSQMNAISNRVIYVEAENVPQITLERARLWEMDLKQIYPLLPEPYRPIDFETLEDRDRLLEMAHALRPGLIIVDSLSMISRRGDANVEEVRPILAFLVGLAGDVGCAMLLIHHTRKRMANVLPGMELTMDDARGSGHILAAARPMLGLSIIQTGPDVDPNGPRELSVLKTNLSKVPDPIGCTFEPYGDDDGVLVHYGDSPERYQAPREVDRCAEWVACYLESMGGPVQPRTIIEDAEPEGFSRATVYKARQILGDKVGNTKGARSPTNEWFWQGEQPLSTDE